MEAAPDAPAWQVMTWSGGRVASLLGTPARRVDAAPTVRSAVDRAPAIASPTTESRGSGPGSPDRPRDYWPATVTGR
jgi:hypothetical protein